MSTNPSNASKPEHWRKALTRLVNVDSCVLTYMCNCARLSDINYEDFLYYADITQKENCTLQRCQSIWHLGITQLTGSPHSGLGRHGRILKQKWTQKEYVSIEQTFNLYLERKRGLDSGSLKALKASDTYWSERTCHDYEQAAEMQSNIFLSRDSKRNNNQLTARTTRKEKRKHDEKQVNGATSSTSDVGPTQGRSKIPCPSKSSRRAEVNNINQGSHWNAPTQADGKRRLLTFEEEKATAFNRTKRDSDVFTESNEYAGPTELSSLPLLTSEKSNESLISEHDPVEQLLESISRPMGSILGSYSWEFVASEGGLEIGIAFGNYYRRCCESSFKAKYPEDALALNATLLIRDSPSPLQLECFGEGFFDLMRDAFKQRVPTNDVADERKLIRDWLDGLVDDDWKREVTLGRLENVAVTKKLLPLKRYLIQAVSEFERVQKNSYSEADGIASFVMPLLRKFYHKPDEARLAYTNNSSKTSIYHRRILELETKTCGHLILHREQLEILNCFLEKFLEY